ncbi:hypothetical protein ACOZ35_00905 [Halorubrum xinjiangense]|uniref:hypothetical protein n=1 Tax=Halorubrum xinjiangense TaxID=261291 RepID=UPI003C703B7A
MTTTETGPTPVTLNTYASPESPSEFVTTGSGIGVESVTGDTAPLSPGTYNLTLRSEHGTEVANDTATVTVEPRSTRNLTAYTTRAVAPGEFENATAVREAIANGTLTPATTASANDTVVYAVNATGLTGLPAAANASLERGADLDRLDGLSFGVAPAGTDDDNESTDGDALGRTPNGSAVHLDREGLYLVADGERAFGTETAPDPGATFEAGFRVDDDRLRQTAADDRHRATIELAYAADSTDGATDAETDDDSTEAGSSTDSETSGSTGTADGSGSTGGGGSAGGGSTGGGSAGGGSTGGGSTDGGSAGGGSAGDGSAGGGSAGDGSAGGGSAGGGSAGGGSTDGGSAGGGSAGGGSTGGGSAGGGSTGGGSAGGGSTGGGSAGGGSTGDPSGSGGGVGSADSASAGNVTDAGGPGPSEEAPGSDANRSAPRLGVGISIAPGTSDIPPSAGPPELFGTGGPERGAGGPAAADSGSEDRRSNDAGGSESDDATSPESADSVESPKSSTAGESSEASTASESSASNDQSADEADASDLGYDEAPIRSTAYDLPGFDAVATLAAVAGASLLARRRGRGS